MVTHCKDRDSYEQLALLEYLAYRTYNLVTDLSLRVRLARIEYVDSERDRVLAERFGFFLEHWDFLAARSGWRSIATRQVHTDEYDEMQRSLFEVFQYFIGNTDWSYALPAPDENECCQTVSRSAFLAVPSSRSHSTSTIQAWSTLPTQRKDPSLPISIVRERLYRGLCRSPASLSAALGAFEIQRPDIVQLFEEAEYLSERSRGSSLRYIGEFYELIGEDKKVEREFMARCRKLEF